MLQGELTTLRARIEADIEVFERELYGDVETRSLSDTRPWIPLAPGSSASPYRARESSEAAAVFSAEARDDGTLVGEALLWGIDPHNRSAHIGLSLLPGQRGRGYGGDVVRVLCNYGFSIRGLHRLQIETDAGNTAMISTALGAGFVEEGRLRENAWALGSFHDEVVYGLLAAEWRSATS